MKSIIVAVLGLAAWSLSWANVNDNLGTLPQNAADVTFQGTFTQRAGATGTTTADSWADSFTFAMASSGDIDLSSPMVVISPPSSLNTVFLNFNIQNNSRYTLIGPNGPESDPFDLAAGQYTLSLSGITGGVGGSATYSGTIHAHYTAAVPEPSTYALMMLGLAGIGFVARRRMA